MTRTNARELVVHLIYEMNATGIGADEALSLRFAEDYYPTLAEENELYSEKPNRKQLDYIRLTAAGATPAVLVPPLERGISLVPV